MTSYGVMKVNEFDDAIFYRVACACGSGDHDANVWLEYDKEIDSVTMSISQTVYWNHQYGCYSWYNRIFKRICASIKILFGGYIEMEADILFSNKEHIKGFIEALDKGMEKVTK